MCCTTGLDWHNACRTVTSPPRRPSDHRIRHLRRGRFLHTPVGVDCHFSSCSLVNTTGRPVNSDQRAAISLSKSFVICFFDIGWRRENFPLIEGGEMRTSAFFKMSQSSVSTYSLNEANAVSSFSSSIDLPRNLIDCIRQQLILIVVKFWNFFQGKPFHLDVFSVGR